MKYGDVKAELENAGEIIITMDSGERYELHLWDCEFIDTSKQIRVTTPSGYHFLQGDAVEDIEVHHSHRLE